MCADGKGVKDNNLDVTMLLLFSRLELHFGLYCVCVCVCVLMCVCMLMLCAYVCVHLCAECVYKRDITYKSERKHASKRARMSENS